MNYLEEKLHDKLLEKQKEVFELQDEKIELQTRIDKAIKYIEEHYIFFRDSRNIGEYAGYLKLLTELLKILKGSDKE